MMRPEQFLGFSFTNGTMPNRRIASKAVLRGSRQESEFSLGEPEASVPRKWFVTRAATSRMAELFGALPNPDRAGPFQ